MSSLKSSRAVASFSASSRAKDFGTKPLSTMPKPVEPVARSAAASTARTSASSAGRVGSDTGQLPEMHRERVVGDGFEVDLHLQGAR